jgi:TolB-like protein/class 3 adenylate cyclase/Flp pilus assembly protein TadD
MAEKHVQRRLAAILAGDVVGYSRLMERDEAGTLVALRTRRREVLEPLVARHQGRIFKVTGDGVLVEFASAVNAIECAVAVQQRWADANTVLPADKRIELRIGINLGDVVVEGGDLFGDGVNVAARLQEVAEPGGICVAASVRDQVRGKVTLGFDDVGERQLKNIAAAVRVYRTVRTTSPSPGSVLTPATDKPSIAVLPFTNMSADSEQEYFSDGITEDIITELSRFRSLFVIARNSSFAFKGKSIKVQDIARELGVAYVVEGSVRRAADRVRITAQLVDSETGNHLWAERYDRDMHDIFALQDEVARSVASTVSGRVEVADRDRAVRLSPNALRAYDLVLRAKALTLKYTRADNEKALTCAERAAEIDPGNARAHVHAAWCHFYNYMACWTTDREKGLTKAYQLAQRAVVLDETDSLARCILAIIHLFRREYDEARSETEKAIDLNPNDATARRYYGLFLAATGKPGAGIEQIDLGRRLNPFDTQWAPWDRGIACFTARRYDEAITALRQVRNPINEVRGWLAASYAQAGRLKEAQATLEEFLRIAETDMVTFPGCRLKDWEPYWHGAFEYQDQKDFDHLFDALRKAGLSE